MTKGWKRVLLLLAVLTGFGVCKGILALKERDGERKETDRERERKRKEEKKRE